MSLTSSIGTTNFDAALADVEKRMVLRADGARMDEIMVENIMVFTSISKKRVEVLFGGKFLCRPPLSL